MFWSLVGYAVIGSSGFLKTDPPSPGTVSLPPLFGPLIAGRASARVLFAGSVPGFALSLGQTNDVPSVLESLAQKLALATEK